MIAIVSEKGQVTIPKAIRDKLGLRPGTRVEFVANNGKLVGRKKIEEDLFKKWRGKGSGLVNKMGGIDEYLRHVRGHNDHGR
jgi:antitoxin PrlF